MSTHRCKEHSADVEPVAFSSCNGYGAQHTIRTSGGKKAIAEDCTHGFLPRPEY